MIIFKYYFLLLKLLNLVKENLENGEKKEKSSITELSPFVSIW